MHASFKKENEKYDADMTNKEKEIQQLKISNRMLEDQVRDLNSVVSNLKKEKQRLDQEVEVKNATIRQRNEMIEKERQDNSKSMRTKPTRPSDCVRRRSSSIPS